MQFDRVLPPPRSYKSQEYGRVAALCRGAVGGCHHRKEAPKVHHASASDLCRGSQKRLRCQNLRVITEWNGDLQ